MSSEDGVLKRPSIWSYASFPRPRRRSSLRLPKTHDPYEKPDRHTSSGRQHHSKSAKREFRVGRMIAGQRTRYFKTGCVAALLLLVLFLLTPDEHRRAIPGASLFRNVNIPDDPLKSTKCTESYSPDRPLIQYVLMIDAGSTGSRIHVYRFNNCGETPELESEVFEQTVVKEGGSGLSSYPNDAEAAARSLDPLLRVAVQSVPEKLQSCTPIAVKATAGLRKLGVEQSDKILTAVRARLENSFPFPLVADKNGGVEVMDGKDEGVYAWITTNYLLGNIGSAEHGRTAAVFDLGGGSAQIVFEPFFKGHDEMKEGDHKYELEFGGRNFTLYQHSYLGYGLMEARHNLHRIVVQNMHYMHPQSQSWLEQPIENPCISVGTSKEVDVALPSGHALGDSVKVTMTGPEHSSPELCRNLTEKVLHKDGHCSLGPCAFDGVYQPEFEKTFAWDDVYLFSYYYDRTYPLGMPERFSLNDFRDLAARVCHGGSHWTAFKAIDGAIDELQGRPETCLDLNYMYVLLTAGHRLPYERQVNVAKKIRGNELGWCLGASLPLLSEDSGWKCKAKRGANIDLHMP